MAADPFLFTQRRMPYHGSPLEIGRMPFLRAASPGEFLRAQAEPSHLPSQPPRPLNSRRYIGRNTMPNNATGRWIPYHGNFREPRRPILERAALLVEVAAAIYTPMAPPLRQHMRPASRHRQGPISAGA